MPHKPADQMILFIFFYYYCIYIWCIPLSSTEYSPSASPDSFFEIWSFSLAFLHSDSAVSLLEVRSKAAGFCRECDMKNDKSYLLLSNSKRAAMDISWDATWQGRFRLMIEEDFATSGPMRDGARENLVLGPGLIPNRLEV